MDIDGKVMGLLVVGTGYLGAQRASAASRTRRLRLVAVTDVDPASAERVAARHGVVAVPGLEAGLESGGVDAVAIATPHADHAEAIRLSLEAGKHVLCEKPLTIRADEARSLATLADESRLRLATGLNHRFYPPVRDALALVGSWAIGRVEGVRAQVGHLASPEFLRSWHTEVSRVGRRNPDGQRPSRLRPDPPVFGRGRAGQGVHPPGCPASQRLRDRSLWPVPQPRQRRRPSFTCELGLADRLPDHRASRERRVSSRSRPPPGD